MALLGGVYNKRFVIVLLVCTISTASWGQSFRLLVVFEGSDGYAPAAPLVQGSDGGLYGTAAGGANNSEACSTGCGIVFRYSLNGSLRTVYNFCAQSNCADGEGPNGLVLGTDGSFYGTTASGGTGAYCTRDGGCGTIFRVTPHGTLTTLYSFCSQPNCADGYSPIGELIQSGDGNLYGVTYIGGNTGCYFNEGCGTVFEITPSGTFTSLYAFCSEYDCQDGELPVGGLVQATDGALYGTTPMGGTGGGTFFKIVSGILTVISSFEYGRGGPSAALTLGSDGNFYGVESNSGLDRVGTVFQITPEGVVTILYEFTKFSGIGIYPMGGLVQDNDGNLYGTTSGTHGSYGAIFQITTAGVLTTIHIFHKKDGEYPVAALVQAKDGSLYGTTLSGGDFSCAQFGCGTLFKVKPQSSSGSKH